MPVLAEKRHPSRISPVDPDNPKGQYLLSDAHSNGYAFSARTAEKLLREAEAEFEAMGAHGYVERVKERLEELGAGSSTV
jgi:hypothetical protein